MNYIEYMKDGNKTSNPQYIPGFKQIQPFKRYLIKPNESAVVPQGMYIRDFKFNTGFLSKAQACEYLNISRSTFDKMIKEGKIPKGKKRQGFKELSWTKEQLNYIK